MRPDGDEAMPPQPCPIRTEFAAIRRASQNADPLVSPADTRVFADFAENAGVAPAPANLTASSDDAPPGANGRGVRDQAEQDKDDSASADAASKAFATIRAQFALCGYTLSRSDASDGPVRFTIGRWGIAQEVPDVAALIAFARDAGVRNG